MTEDELAFIREIAMKPDDVTTRLIYADWLDEHNDPRGEHIRLECAAARSPDSEEAFALRAMSYQLQQEYRHEWVQALGPGVMWHNFRLGLIDDIVIRSNDLIANNGMSLRYAPVTKLGINLWLEHVRPFAELDSLSYVAHLRLGHSRLSGDGLEILVERLRAPRLVELSLSHCGIGRAKLIRLLNSPLGRQLQWINVEENPVTHDPRYPSQLGRPRGRMNADALREALGPL